MTFKAKLTQGADKMTTLNLRNLFLQVKYHLFPSSQNGLLIHLCWLFVSKRNTALVIQKPLLMNTTVIILVCFVFPVLVD